MGEKLPLSYMMLEKLVQEEKNKYYPPVISKDIFLELAEMSSITQKKSVDRAGNLLHNYGHIVYFERDPVLSEIVILNPQWLTDMMSTLITTKHRFASQGIVEHSNFKQLWKPPYYPTDLHPVLYSLLKRFEIAYELSEDIANVFLDSIKPKNITVSLSSNDVDADGGILDLDDLIQDKPARTVSMISKPLDQDDFTITGALKNIGGTLKISKRNTTVNTNITNFFKKEVASVEKRSGFDTDTLAIAADNNYDPLGISLIPWYFYIVS